MNCYFLRQWVSVKARARFVEQHQQQQQQKAGGKPVVDKMKGEHVPQLDFQLQQIFTGIINSECESWMDNNQHLIFVNKAMQITFSQWILSYHTDLDIVKSSGNVSDALGID